jgi:hypothetical protein
MVKLEAFRIDAQEYIRVGDMVHRTPDGHTITLALWRTDCARCGCPFTFRTGKRGIPQRPNRRCSACAKPRVRARAALVPATFSDLTRLASPSTPARLSRGTGRSDAVLHDRLHEHTVAATGLLSDT